MSDAWLEIDEGRKIKIFWIFAEDDSDETGGALGEGIRVWEQPANDKDPEEIEHYVASAAAREFATEESKNTDDGLEFETLAKAKKALAAAKAVLKVHKTGAKITKPKTVKIEFELLFDTNGKKPICADITRKLYCKLYRIYSTVDHHCGYLCCSLKHKGHQVMPDCKCPLHGGK